MFKPIVRYGYLRLNVEERRRVVVVGKFLDSLSFLKITPYLFMELMEERLEWTDDYYLF